MRLLLFLVASVFQQHLALAACGGHGTSETMVVSTAWLAGHLNDPNLVTLAIGQKKDYDATHIPGSLFLNVPDIYLAKSPEGLRTELPPMEHLADVFESLGVTNDSRVVIYLLKNGSPQSAARVYVTLDAMGLGAQAGLLNGGLPAWQSEGRSVTAEVPVVHRGKLQPCPQDDVIAKLDSVRASMRRPGIAIVDARTPEFYTGAQIPQGQRGGHIPGASNIPYSSLADSDGTLPPPETLQSRFRDAGVKPGDRVISYCHIGMQASYVYFVARYLGYDARMYDGSWDEWSAHSDLPVER